MYCVLAFKNTYINLTHEKIMNLIIKIFENKVKPKSQFINEKQSKFLNLKKKWSKDRLTQEFEPMDLI